MRYLICSLLMLSISLCIAQAPAIDDSPEAMDYKKQYEKNIRLTKIRGIYIPKSMDEAFERLKKLSPPASLEKFRAAPEKQVCKKLHFGLGKWMSVKWNFETGSRFSHMLKEMGILHPDDMVQFALRTFHRHLNQKDLKTEELVAELGSERKAIAKQVLEN